MQNKGKILKVVVALMIAAQMLSAAIDITAKFTDPYFKAKVYWEIEKTSPAAILDSDVSDITRLYLYVGMITSLTGIEYFTALTSLNCSGNQLTTLDVSKNAAMEVLSCSNNQLTELDVSKNTKIIYLNVTNNYFTGEDKISAWTNQQLL
ncbi:MAG: hypothetical protein LBH98_00535 [Chitinispirillales bacterium]|jgi:Leucine-rich repeat (LRR) protein|nr:hypothetical protein [Chitinispirillales bacterium]